MGRAVAAISGVSGVSAQAERPLFTDESHVNDRGASRAVPSIVRMLAVLNPELASKGP